MKLGIHTGAYLRYDVLDIYIDWLNIIRKDYDVVLAITADDPKIKKKCLDNKIIYFKSENTPLGRKFNTASLMRAIDIDYLMLMGSDNICDNNMLQIYFRLMESGIDFWGMRDIYFYETKSRSLKYWPGFKNHYREGESLGAGRCISRKVLDKLDWKLWNDNENVTLDKSMTEKFNSIKVNNITLSIKEENCFLLDIKSGLNMSRFEQYKGELLHRNTLINYFPRELVKKIFTL